MKSAGRYCSGFTILETSVAMTILAVAMVVVVQLGYWSVREKARNTARQVALELAANVLESARAQPWESLTPEWAAHQLIPEYLIDQLPEGILAVTVEPEESLPQTMRVTVELRWMLDEGVEAQPLRLVSLFSSRKTSAGGEKP